MLQFSFIYSGRVFYILKPLTNLRSGKGTHWQNAAWLKSRCLWKVCLVEKWMPFPESFNDGPIPSSSKREGETWEILLADLNYSNQACLNVCSKVIVSRIRTNSQGMRLQRQAYPYISMWFRHTLSPKRIILLKSQLEVPLPTHNNGKTDIKYHTGFVFWCFVRVRTSFFILWYLHISSKE